MTTPSSDIVRKVASPATILGQIDAPGETPRHAVIARNNDTNFPKLRVVYADEEVFDDQLDQPLEVPLQIAELTGHLLSLIHI